MTHPGIDLLRQLLDDAGINEGTLLERREKMAANVAGLQSPEGIVSRSGWLAGSPAEWSIPHHEPDEPDHHSGTVVVHFHGGGYCTGNLDSHRVFAGRLALAVGEPVVTVDYPLAPEHPFPAAVEHGVRCYHELIGSGRDPSRVALSGDSAGGGLVMALLLSLRDAGDPLPAAAVLQSPWVDLTQAAPCHTELDGLDPLLRTAQLDEMAAAYLAGTPATDPLASPLLAQDLSGLPPVRIDAGDREVLHDDAVRLAARLDDAGVPTELQVWPGLTHDFQLIGEEIFPEAAESIAAIGRFVGDRLG